MKRIVTLLLIVCASLSLYSQKQAIIIDHKCVKIENVPETYISKVKSDLRMAYQHTSHGSQLPSGMSVLKAADSRFNYGTSAGQLYFRDTGIPGASDLGNPDRTTWATATRTLLNNNTNNINMIMWSWCGQVSSATESDITSYLNLMSQLETDFPNVTFVYMTGHLDGSGVNGNLNKRNEQIRTYCKNNGKILFDFADIESYDPDGNYYLDKGANDNCDYSDNGTSKNWAQIWCANNPGICGSCSCAHSQCLNCQQKGKAFWWMMARVAGWDGITGSVDIPDVVELNGQGLLVVPNPVNTDGVIKYRVTDGPVSISICDVFGKVVISYNGLPSEPGTYNLPFATSALASGFYYARLNNGRESVTSEFVVSK